MSDEAPIRNGGLLLLSTPQLEMIKPGAKIPAEDGTEATIESVDKPSFIVRFVDGRRTKYMAMGVVGK